MLVMNVIMVAPLLYSLFISFTDWALSRPGSASTFVGVANYWDALRSGAFWKSLQVTLVFAVVASLTELVLGTLFALLLDREFVGRRIVRVLVLIPMLLTPAAIGMFWKLLFEQQAGVFNFFAVSLGLGRIPWLGVGGALGSIMLVDVWQWTPFMALLVLAGLQSVDGEVLEAAQVDGATRLQKFAYVVLPFLVPYLITGLLFRLTDALREFDKVYLLTQGGPGQETQTMSIFIFESGFKFFEIGKTSATSWIFTALVLIIVWPLLSYVSRRGDVK
jgi:multiple sugar transport system permease protein/sorbitol/mannitol transport system permease protein